jgi:23S rRNA (adenine2503-C2)-methyltransferase
MNKQDRRDIRSLSLQEIEAVFEQWGEARFRAQQLHEWLWKKSAISFSQMTNLSLPLREKLREQFSLEAVQLRNVQQSADGTVKIAMELRDGRLIEGVMIPDGDRSTACVSSQVGCSLSCSFCATGLLKRERNLDAAEIYDQVVLLNEAALRHHGKPLTNIVYMGMGEPLLNYDQVMESIQRITSADGLNISPRRITLSTSGVARGIRRLADEQVRFNLALSLHAADNRKRNEIMDINRSNPIEEVIESLRYFREKTRQKITFEYVLLDRVNDHPEDAEQLAALALDLDVFVNLIEFNPVEELPYKRTSSVRRDAFAEYLRKRGVEVRIRRSRGKDIDAACGQLANREENSR